ncbi:Uncharacterised protein [Yersinia intermedia]|nr:Uncharacterised protein [Yersinia intermedia]
MNLYIYQLIKYISLGVVGGGLFLKCKILAGIK